MVSSVAFVCHPYHRGGVTRWMADAAMAFAAKGVKVYFVTVTPSSPFVSAGGREPMVHLLAGNKSVQLITTPAGFTFEFGSEEYRTSVYARQIQTLVPQGTPIIVSDDMAVWAAAASIADRYPMIGVLHGDQDYYYDRARRFHAQLSVCVCVSGRVLRRVQEKCPVLSAAKIALIPCGIELPLVTPARPADGVLQLAFIGRLTDYEKRAEDLVKIAALLQQKGVNFHLHIAGNTEASAIDFQAQFAENGAGDRVTFHGWQAKQWLQALLDRTDIVLLTSNSEGMPLVMMEALASGCGFVGTRVSGIEDYGHDVRAVNCVAVYPVGNIEDAVAAISRVAQVPEVDRRNAARLLAATEFSMDVCLARYTAAIQAASLGRATPFSFPATKRIVSDLRAVARYMKVKMRHKKDLCRSKGLFGRLLKQKFRFSSRLHCRHSCC